MDGYQTFMSRKVCVNSTSLLFTFQYGNFSTPTNTHSISEVLTASIFESGPMPNPMKISSIDTQSHPES